MKREAPELFRPGMPMDKSALEEAGQRTLMRVILASTGVTLCGFSVLQMLAGNHLLATFEILVGLVMLWGAWRIVRVRNLTLWIYLYLIPTYCFLVYIMIMPKASPTAFVWVYMIPLLSYLLLGRNRGFGLSLPFGLIAIVLYMDRYPSALTPEGLIDLGNAVLCGLMIMFFVHLYETRRAAAFMYQTYLAQTDALTGAASRRSFQQALERSIQESTRSNSHLVLVILDIDHFKNVNDRWGHEAGDRALQHICDCLQRRLRVTDYLGRLGGEEFGLLLRDTDRIGADPMVEELRRQIANNALHYDNHVISLSATFGLAEWPADGASADELYRCADRRLYWGKERGRNQLVSFDAVVGTQPWS